MESYVCCILILLLGSSSYQPVAPESLDGLAEWQMDEGCPEPPPVLNAIRTVNDGSIAYLCRDQSSYQLTQIYCNGGTYDRQLPECPYSCGTQPQWSGVSVTSMPGTYIGDVITFMCQSSGVSKTWQGVCTYGGWDVVYPECLMNNILSAWMTRRFSDGSSLYWNACSYSPVYGERPWVSTSITWGSDLYDVSIVLVLLSPHIDNSWVTNFDIVFIRSGDEVERVNFQRTDTHSDIVYEASELHLAVSDVRIQAVDASSIGACNIEVYGQVNDGVCPTLAVPYYVSPQMHSDTATLQCITGYSYIGGDKDMTCAYNLTWVYTGPVGIECTNRPNLAEDTSRSQQTLETSSTASNNNHGFYTHTYNYNYNYHHHGRKRRSLHSTQETVEVTVDLTHLARVERVVIQLDNSLTADTVEVLYEDTLTGQTSGTACQLDEDYTDGSYRVFFCDEFPMGQKVVFATQTQSWYSDVISQIDDLFVLGTSLDTNEHLECYQSPNGQDYRGTVSTAINDHPCLEWTVANPNLTDEDFPDDTIASASNYCRNPGGHDDRPFCFTSEGIFPCPVPKCSDICTMTSNGDDYMGSIQYGQEHWCRAWTDEDVPYVPDWDFPDGSREEAQNHCRNPANLQSRPWCYVHGPPMAELCDIPSCPTTETLSLKPASWQEADAYLNHEQAGWFVCYQIEWDSNSAEDGVIFQYRLYDNIESRNCNSGDDVSFWVSCASMRNDALEWVVFRVSCVDLPQTSTVDLPQTSTVDLPQTSTVDLPQTSTVDLPQTSTVGLLQTSTVDLLQTSTVDLPQTSTVDLPQTSTMDLPQTSTVDLPQTPTVDLPQMQTVDLLQTSTVDLPQTSIVDLPQTSTVDLPQTSTVGLPQMSTVDLPQMSTVDLPQTSTVGLPQTSTVDLPQTSTVDLPQTSTVDLPQTSTMDFRQTSGMHLPQTTEFLQPSTTNLLSPSETTASEIVPTQTAYPQTATTASLFTSNLLSEVTVSILSTEPVITAAQITTTTLFEPLTSYLDSILTTPFEPASSLALSGSIIIISASSSSSFGSSGSSLSITVGSDAPDTTTTGTSFAGQFTAASRLAFFTGSNSSRAQCPCSCTRSGMAAVTDDELESISDAIKEELYVDKSRLSSTKRRKTCAQDDRPEAVTSGVITVMFMTSAVTVVVIHDVVQIVGQVREFWGWKTLA